MPVPDWGMAVTTGAHLVLLALTAMSQHLDGEAEQAASGSQAPC